LKLDGLLWSAVAQHRFLFHLLCVLAGIEKSCAKLQHSKAELDGVAEAVKGYNALTVKRRIAERR
jgi:hypothetical protein